MAYTPRQQFDGGEEEEGGFQAPGAPTAPTISGPTIGNTPSVGGTVSGNSAAAPQSQKQGATAGTGFTNIDKYLNANKGAGADLEKAASGVRSTDDKNFGEAKGAFDTKVKAETPGQIDVNGIVNGVLGAPVSAPNTIGNPGTPTQTSGPKQARGLGDTGPNQAPGPAMQWVAAQGNEDGGYYQPAPFVPDSGSLNAAQGILSDTYEGPTNLDYAIGDTKEARQARALGNADSAGVTMAEMGGPLALYNPALSAIDRAIYGNATGSLEAINKGNNESTDKQTEGKKLSERGASDAAGLVASNKDALTSALTARGDDITKRVAQEANKANALEKMKEAQGPGSTGATWQPGSVANASQFYTDSDISSLNMLGKLLGNPDMAGVKKGQAFQGGKWQPKAPAPAWTPPVNKPAPVWQAPNFVSPRAVEEEERKKREALEEDIYGRPTLDQYQ